VLGFDELMLFKNEYLSNFTVSCVSFNASAFFISQDAFYRLFKTVDQNLSEQALVNKQFSLERFRLNRKVIKQNTLLGKSLAARKNDQKSANASPEKTKIR